MCEHTLHQLYEETQKGQDYTSKLAGLFCHPMFEPTYTLQLTRHSGAGSYIFPEIEARTETEEKFDRGAFRHKKATRRIPGHTFIATRH